MTIRHMHDAPAVSRRDRSERAGARARRRAGVRADGDHPPGLPDQHLGHADLLPDEVGRAREARPQVPGIRGAVRQPHHAADGRPPGRPRHLCRPVVPDRPRQGRPRRHRADRICRQDRAGRDPQGPQHHQSVADLKGKKIANQVGSSVGNVFVDTIGPKFGAAQSRLPGSPDERQRHGRRHGGQDRRRHGQCRALQRDRRRRRHRRSRSWISPASTACRC